MEEGGFLMTEYIYGDVLFIINFSMDFISLFICGKIMHFRMNPWRMALAATLGGAYGVAKLFFSLGFFGDLALDGIIALALCYVAHYHGSSPKTFGTTAIFLAVSMLIGGAMTALYSKIGKYQTYIEIGGEIHTVFGDIPLWLFAFLAAVSAFLTFFLQKAAHRRMSARICRVRITFPEGIYEFSALIDTGNMASEPVSGGAVVFLSEAAVRRLYGKSRDLLFTDAGSVEGEEAKLLRFIPVNTVSGYTLVSAMRPQKFEIAAGRAFEERYVLVARDAFSSDYGGAEVLVPYSVL
jgi:sigma-E processing peptidase SpoIIGA